MGKTSKSSFKKVAAGVLAVITLASYSFPANTGILSNRPTLSANATGTENSIHVYGSLRNATGNNLTVVYRPQNSLSTSSVKTFEDGELWDFDGDITMIYSPVKLVFPTQWNTDFQKTEETPHVDDITNEEYDDEKDQYVYTFNSPKGNTYQYENLTYAKREVVFAKRGDFIDNGNGTHTNPFDNTIEEHDTTKFEVSAETKGDYGFEEISPGLWRSNNYGKYYTSTSNAKTTFKVKVEDGHAINLNYWVSNEENIDYLKLTIDNVNVFKQKNGIVEGATNRSSGCFTLSPGKTHTIVAEYCHFKDPTEEAITATSRYLDAAMIQFSSPCSKCDNTPVRAYMQFDRLWKGDLGVENGEHIMPTLTWGNTGKKYWLNRKSSVYSNESLYFDCPDNNFTVTEHIGNFKYESVNYRHRYDIEIPNPELGVFIDVSQGYYDDTNYLFSCKAKKGVSTDLSKLTVNDFVITMDPSLDEEEAARLKAVIESDKTIKWIKTFTNGSVYYVIYNPELAEYDEWDDTAFISYCVYDVTKYEITDSDLVSPVDLITLDKNGKANPNSFVTVVAENADGTSSALVANKDYKFVSAASTSESGEFTVELNGIGDCTGYASKTMTVVSADELTKVEAKAPGKDGYGNIEYYTVNDKYYLPVEGYTNGYKEVSEKDVIIEGTASVISDDFIVPAVDLIVLDKNGKASPNNYVSVVDGNATELTEGTDYEFVSAASTNESGEFTVEINGIGDYTGTASKAMNIVAASDLTKVEAKAANIGVVGNIEYFTVDGKCFLPVDGYENGYKEVSEADVIIEPIILDLSDDFIVPVVDLIVLDNDGKASPNNYVSVIGKDLNGKDSKLTEGTDYEFISTASTNESGEFIVEISGIGGYTGTASKAMNVIAASDLTKVEAKAAELGVNGNIEYFTVDGKCFLPVDGYENGYKEVPEASVIIKALTFELSDDSIVPAVDLIVLDKNGKASPNNYVSVVDGNATELTEGADYEFISAASTSESGEFEVEISGIGAYTGTASKAMNVIAASDLTKVEAKAAEKGINGNIEYFTVDGKCFLPVDGYENGYKEVSEADVIIEALTFELSDDFIVPAVDLIVLDKDGKASPNNYVSVVEYDKDGNATKLTEGTDFEFVSATSTNKSGKFTVEISGIGAYTGTASKAMNVIAASDLTKVEAKAAEKGINGNIEYFTVDGKCFLPVDGYENGYKEVSEADVIIEAEPFTVPSFKTQNLVLSGQIGVNFFLDLSGLTDEEKAASYVEFTVNGKTTKDTFDESFKNQTGEYYGFTCYVTSVQMADTITAVFHYGDETVERTYSVLEYIKAVEKISDKLEPEMVALVQSISDYGHYVQPMLAETNKWTIGVDHEEMTKYYAESYNFEDIKEVVKKYAHKSNLVKTDIDKITYSLSLNAETALNVFVSPNANYSGNISISVDGLSENDYTVTKQASDGRYKIVITNISAHKLGNTYKINITTDNGTSTYQASALSFINAVLNANYDTNTKNAASSIYKYYEATMTYRNK